MRVWVCKYAGNLRSNGLMKTKEFVSGAEVERLEGVRQCHAQARNLMDNPRLMSPPTTRKIHSKEKTHDRYFLH